MCVSLTHVNYIFFFRTRDTSLVIYQNWPWHIISLPGRLIQSHTFHVPCAHSPCILKLLQFVDSHAYKSIFLLCLPVCELCRRLVGCGQGLWVVLVHKQVEVVHLGDTFKCLLGTKQTRYMYMYNVES